MLRTPAVMDCGTTRLDSMVRCVHCGKKITPESWAKGGADIIRFSSLETLVRDDKYRRFLCERCGRSTIVYNEGGEWISLTHAPSHLYLPHYCSSHQIAFFDPVGLCPFCVAEKGV